MSVAWEAMALRRSGLTERQANAMLELSAAAEHAVAYPTKQAVRVAWESSGDEERVQLTSPAVVFTKNEIDRYAELIKKLGL